MTTSNVRGSGRNAWTRDQLKLAFYLYCQIPFGKLHQRNPEIVGLARAIGRTPGAVAMKLVNFASLDPLITNSGRKGLTGASLLDRRIWDEFHADWDRLAVECEQLREKLLFGSGDVSSSAVAEVGLPQEDYSGETRLALVQQRIKQQFFRRAVLSGYRNRCCISGVSDTRLLVASHIVPWSSDKANRLNPSNGLCLSAIHDKAFDCYLFSLTDDLRVELSGCLKTTKDEFLKKTFWPVDGRLIELPERFAPDQSLIARHRANMLSLHEGVGLQQ